MTGRTKIVLVEDNLNLSENVKEMLTIQGYEVTGILDNAEEAYAKIEKDAPDAILLDIRLTGVKSGISLAEELRESLSIPIIFMTSSSGRDIVDKVRHIKPDGFITKPFTTENMVTSLELAIQNFKQNTTKSTLSKRKTEKSPTEIFIRESGWLKKIVIKDIDWIKADGSYTHIFVNGKQFTLRNTAKEVVQKLPEGQFERIHKSYIVNMKKIEAISASALKIDDTELPIGRNYYQKLLQNINRFSN